VVIELIRGEGDRQQEGKTEEGKIGKEGSLKSFFLLFLRRTIGGSFFLFVK